MYCEYCGKKRDSNDNFCTQCGKPLNINPQLPNDINLVLILGIISCVFIIIPIISIPLAIISIVIGIKNKQRTNLIPAIISLVLSIVGIIIIVLGLATFYNSFKTEISNELFEENYYYENIPTEDSYDISGHHWLGDDNSLLNLEQNHTYIWYQTRDNINNYYEGIYEVYTGYDAVSYIAKNLPEYGLTEYDQTNNIIKSNHTINEYYLIKLISEKVIINGIEQTTTNNTIYYYGYYEEEDNYLDLINIATQNKAGFTMKEEINTIGMAKNFQF